MEEYFKKNEFIIYTEVEFCKDITNLKHAKSKFNRVIAKKINFSYIDFSFSIFENCYFRNCNFERCKFIGSHFVDSNLRGSTFTGCVFDYSTFKNTHIDLDQISKNLPEMLNVRKLLAQNLRVNFSQIGEFNGVNYFVTEELKTTKKYYQSAAFPKSTYYCHKYYGNKRVVMFFKFISFILLEFLWGHGESIYKILRFTLIIIILSATISFIGSPPNSSIFLYLKSAFVKFILPSDNTSVEYSAVHITFLTYVRYIILALFTSTLIKRLSRR